MPRLRADGPALEAAPQLLAYADGRVVRLHDPRTLAVTAEASLPGVSDLAFVSPAGGPRLMALAHARGTSVVHALALPTLERAGSLELTGPAKLIAASGERLLVSAPDAT